MTWKRRRTAGRRLLAAAAGCALAALAGCANSSRFVEIDSKPPGAAIYVNGERRGTTRDEKVLIDFASDTKGRVLIQVVKPRYKPAFQYWTIDEVPAKKLFILEVD